jgi:hypothetical protein
MIAAGMGASLFFRRHSREGGNPGQATSPGPGFPLPRDEMGQISNDETSEAVQQQSLPIDQTA